MSSRLIITGFRSIEECLEKNPERISKILVPSGRIAPRIERLQFLARERGVRIETNPNANPEEPVLALMKDYQYSELDALLPVLKEAIDSGNRPVVVALDGVTDPHNLGAVLRTAAFMGVNAVLFPKDRSAGINETVYRIASGGVEHVSVAQVTNLVSALKQLKEAGFWIVGFSEHAEQGLTDVPLNISPVIVIGNEEKGLRQLVRENCDFLVKIPSRGGLESLNASVAAALAMSWAVKLF